jgi:metallo-beta-lactamase family protein
VFGEQVPLRARVEVLNGYSAHADRSEMQGWLEAVRASSPDLEDVFLVHGEARAQDAFAARLEKRGFRVHCPRPGTDVTR